MQAFVSGTFMTDYVSRLDNTIDISYKSHNARNVPRDTSFSSIFMIHVDTDFNGSNEGSYIGIPYGMPRVTVVLDAQVIASEY